MDHYLFSGRLHKRGSQIDANLSVTMPDGTCVPLSYEDMYAVVCMAGKGYDTIINYETIVDEALKNIFDGIPSTDLIDALILGAVGLIEKDPAYGFVAGRLLLRKLYQEVCGKSLQLTDVIDHTQYRLSFISAVTRGVEIALFDRRLLDFDLDYLAQHLVCERDNLFDYMGLRVLYERYFAKIDVKRIEMPQAFWMRVAMGLSYHESDREKSTLEFYHLMSTMRYIPSTPTLLHAGYKRPQLSSCFLTTIPDDLHQIFKAFSDNAQMSKWSGGVANDWTQIRATGSLIQSINTESQGVVPFLKIASDVTAAINRSGSRRGATVVYLEVWHYEIEDFLDLRRNTGDERRRTHDINTANWVPDLFMQRVMSKGMWTLFSPDEVPDLHNLYGAAFKKRYEEYELLAQDGKIKLFKHMEAGVLWKKMLTRLFETGHPWITFKDACNVRSPQDHVGVIHSSNLCTEITLNTSADEIAVCNIGSLNIARHMVNGQCDYTRLQETIVTAIRILDNIIDIGFCPVIEGTNSNMRHRPIGLGLMGLQDALYESDMTFDSPGAAEFSTDLMEFIAYHAIYASSQLAKERGVYSSYKGSKWDRDIFPQDTLELLAKERGEAIPVVRNEKLDWSIVRAHVKKYGMRNSNTMAIAPTATISTITGCFPCVEPIYKNIYVKANMNGEFTVINKYLVEDLKKIELWDVQMVNDLKFYDGNVQNITRIPEKLRNKYKDVFDFDPLLLVSLASLRGQWIDQSQSLNIFMKGVSGKLLDEIYTMGWKLGIKTFYYLRTLGASQTEKATLDAGVYGFTQKRDNGSGTTNGEQRVRAATVCSLSTDPSCESCQ